MFIAALGLTLFFVYFYVVKLATRILDRSNVATLLSANDGRSNNEVSVTQPSAWVQILTTEKKSAWLCTGEEGTDFLVKTLLVYLGPGQMLWTWLPGVPKNLSCWLWGCLGGKVWTTSLIPRFSMNQWLIIPWGIFKSLAICFFPLENVEKLYIFHRNWVLTQNLWERVLLARHNGSSWSCLSICFKLRSPFLQWSIAASIWSQRASFEVVGTDPVD